MKTSIITELPVKDAKNILRATEEHLQNFSFPATLTGDLLVESVMKRCRKDGTTKLVQPLAVLYLTLVDALAENEGKSPSRRDPRLILVA